MNPIFEVKWMDSKIAWELFLETGAPEFYVMYHQVRKAETLHVLDSPRPGA